MSNDKKKQQKKKQRERDIKRRKIDNQQYASRQAKLAAYPKIRIGKRDADPEFIDAVIAAAKTIDFLDEKLFGSAQQAFYRMGKAYGFKRALDTLRDIPSINYGGRILGGNAKLAIAYLTLGVCILDRVPLDIRRKYMPYNGMFVDFESTDIMLNFTQIESAKTDGGKVYYSPLKPKISWNGKELFVGFTRHSIDQICKRINPRYTDYGASGDVHAFFRSCIYFETTTLLNNKPALVLYNMCFLPGFAHYGFYAEKVFGLDNLVEGEGRLFYKLGYCPIEEQDGFAKAITFLPPGYCRTPEYAKIKNARIPQEIKNRLVAKATDESWVESDKLMLYDTEVVEWLHNNGMPQVFQMKQKIYDYSHWEKERKDVIFSDATGIGVDLSNYLSSK